MISLQLIDFVEIFFQLKSATTSSWSTHWTRTKHNVSRIWIWRWRLSNVIRYWCISVWHIHIDLQFRNQFTITEYVFNEIQLIRISIILTLNFHFGNFRRPYHNGTIRRRSVFVKSIPLGDHSISGLAHFCLNLLHTHTTQPK